MPAYDRLEMLLPSGYFSGFKVHPYVCRRHQGIELCYDGLLKNVQAENYPQGVKGRIIILLTTKPPWPCALPSQITFHTVIGCINVGGKEGNHAQGVVGYPNFVW